MHFFSSPRATWLLLACAAIARVTAAEDPSSGVVEVDLVFPRNQTFAPTSRMPIIFAYQHPELALALNTFISFSVWNIDKADGAVLITERDMRWANFSSRDPYLSSAYHTQFNTEGHWLLKWYVTWRSCTERSLELGYSHDRITTNETGGEIYFTTSRSAPEIDLVAATDNKDCSKHLGVAIDVTKTLRVPGWVRWSGSDTCAVVASVTRTPKPCRVKLDPSAVSSMAASMTARACYMEDPRPEDIDCPPKSWEKKKSAAHQLAVGGAAFLAVAVGAVGYLATI